MHVHVCIYLAFISPGTNAQAMIPYYGILAALYNAPYQHKCSTQPRSPNASTRCLQSPDRSLQHWH